MDLIWLFLPDPNKYIRFALTAIVCTGRIQPLCAGVSVGLKKAKWGCEYFLEFTFAGSGQREEACGFPTMFRGFMVILRSGFARS
jgi:hypothetical protein